MIVSEPDHGAKAVRLLLSVARTPAEIAVSIVAELVAGLRRPDA